MPHTYAEKLEALRLLDSYADPSYDVPELIEMVPKIKINPLSKGIMLIIQDMTLAFQEVLMQGDYQGMRELIDRAIKLDQTQSHSVSMLGEIIKRNRHTINDIFKATTQRSFKTKYLLILNYLCSTTECNPHISPIATAWFVKLNKESKDNSINSSQQYIAYYLIKYLIVLSSLRSIKSNSNSELCSTSELIPVEPTFSYSNLRRAQRFELALDIPSSQTREPKNSPKKPIPSLDLWDDNLPLPTEEVGICTLLYLPGVSTLVSQEVTPGKMRNELLTFAKEVDQRRIIRLITNVLSLKEESFELFMPVSRRPCPVSGYLSARVGGCITPVEKTQEIMSENASYPALSTESTPPKLELPSIWASKSGKKPTIKHAPVTKAQTVGVSSLFHPARVSQAKVIPDTVLPKITRLAP